MAWCRTPRTTGCPAPRGSSCRCSHWRPHTSPRGPGPPWEGAGSRESRGRLRGRTHPSGPSPPGVRCARSPPRPAAAAADGSARTRRGPRRDPVQTGPALKFLGWRMGAAPDRRGVALAEREAVGSTVPVAVQPPKPAGVYAPAPPDTGVPRTADPGNITVGGATPHRAPLACPTVSIRLTDRLAALDEWVGGVVCCRRESECADRATCVILLEAGPSSAAEQKARRACRDSIARRAVVASWSVGQWVAQVDTHQAHGGAVAALPFRTGDAGRAVERSRVGVQARCQRHDTAPKPPRSTMPHALPRPSRPEGR